MCYRRIRTVGGASVPQDYAVNAGLAVKLWYAGVMPLPQKFDPANPPLGQRRCPKCGLPLFLSCIEPSDQDDHDQRTFECSKCVYAETVIVNLR